MLNFAISAISSAISSFLPAVSQFCATIVPKITTMIGNPAVWQTISNAVSTISQVFQIFRAGETVEQMGDRALQAAESGIKPEHYEDWSDYAAAVRDFKIDAFKSESYSPEQKLTAGIAVALEGLESKFDLRAGALGGLPLLVAGNPAYFTADRLVQILSVTRDISGILDYLADKLGDDDSATFASILTGVERNMHPDKSDADIKAELRDVAQRYQHV